MCMYVVHWNIFMVNKYDLQKKIYKYQVMTSLDGVGEYRDAGSGRGNVGMSTLQPLHTLNTCSVPYSLIRRPTTTQIITSKTMKKNNPQDMCPLCCGQLNMVTGLECRVPRSTLLTSAAVCS